MGFKKDFYNKSTEPGQHLTQTENIPVTSISVTWWALELCVSIMLPRSNKSLTVWTACPQGVAWFPRIPAWRESYRLPFAILMLLEGDVVLSQTCICFMSSSLSFIDRKCFHCSTAFSALSHCSFSWVSVSQSWPWRHTALHIWVSPLFPTRLIQLISSWSTPYWAAVGVWKRRKH